MASKKDFSALKTGNRTAPAGAQTTTVTTAPAENAWTTGSKVMANIAQATSRKGQQATASPQEAAERKEKMQTQGRKGVRSERINMAFSDSNYQFIKIMAKATGKTMTEFTNAIIAAYQREHPELMEQAQAFLDTVNSGAFSNLFGGGND